MGILEKLNCLSTRIQDIHPVAFHWDLNMDSSGEILFKYSVTYGFSLLLDKVCLLNACSHETNIKGFNNELDLIEKRIEKALKQGKPNTKVI